MLHEARSHTFTAAEKLRCASAVKLGENGWRRCDDGERSREEEELSFWELGGDGYVLCRRNTLFSGSDVHWPSDGPVLLNRERSCETRRQRWQNQTFLALKGQGEMMADMVDKL
jgi:hypothetical protein